MWVHLIHVVGNDKNIFFFDNITFTIVFLVFKIVTCTINNNIALFSFKKKHCFISKYHNIL